MMNESAIIIYQSTIVVFPVRSLATNGPARSRITPFVAKLFRMAISRSSRIRTNTLPIRRLELAVGQSAPVRAVWLRFPGFAVERLDQVYSRVDVSRYRYESGGASFVTELRRMHV